MPVPGLSARRWVKTKLRLAPDSASTDSLLATPPGRSSTSPAQTCTRSSRKPMTHSPFLKAFSVATFTRSYPTGGRGETTYRVRGDRRRAAPAGDRHRRYNYLMPIIEAIDLSKTYRVAQKQPGLWGAPRGLVRREDKEGRAVHGGAFAGGRGEMVAFLGPPGAVATTALKMLSGLIYPSAGVARVLDFVPWRREDAFRRRFALVMGQKNQLWWDL